MEIAAARLRVAVNVAFNKEHEKRTISQTVLLLIRRSGLSIQKLELISHGKVNRARIAKITD